MAPGNKSVKDPSEVAAGPRAERRPRYTFGIFDLNMMRAGAVDHTSEWKHTAYHEFSSKKRYKQVINFPRLLNALEIDDFDSFKSWYIKTLEMKLACIDSHRELYWSRAKAVGDANWLNDIEGKKKKYR